MTEATAHRPLTDDERDLLRKWAVNNLLARAALVAAKKGTEHERL